VRKFCLMSENAQRAARHGGIVGLHVLVHYLYISEVSEEKADAALIVDDADADHAGLIRHFGDDVIEAVALDCGACSRRCCA